jgi:hypothetical protein
VSSDSIKENKQHPLQAFDQMNAIVNGDGVSIPDVSKLEQELVDLLSL